MPGQTAPAVRKSIKNYFPLGYVFCKGSNNPLTIHDANDEMFAAVWSVIAETMLVEHKLPRSTKEEIALIVSENNNCPVCVTAHAMMKVAAVKAEREGRSNSKMSIATKIDDRHEESLLYARRVLNATHKVEGMPGLCKQSGSLDFPHLDDEMKAEIALIVLLFEHMNRAVSVIMGERMTSAMFGFPKPVANTVEGKGFLNLANRMMARVMGSNFRSSPKRGFTKNIFEEQDESDLVAPSSTNELPSILKGISLLDSAQTTAVVRLHTVSDKLYGSQIKTMLSPQTLMLLDAETKEPPTVHFSDRAILPWLQEKLIGIEDEKEKAAAILIMLTSVAPKHLHSSTEWKVAVREFGEKETRLLILWWSIRLSFKRAKGFEGCAEMERS